MHPNERVVDDHGWFVDKLEHTQVEKLLMIQFLSKIQGPSEARHFQVCELQFSSHTRTQLYLHL